MDIKTEAQKVAECFTLAELPTVIDDYIARDARYNRAGNYSTPLARFNRACIRAMRARLAK